MGCDQLFWAGNVGSGSHDRRQNPKGLPQRADLPPDLRTTPAAGSSRTRAAGCYLRSNVSGLTGRGLLSATKRMITHHARRKAGRGFAQHAGDSASSPRGYSPRVNCRRPNSDVLAREREGYPLCCQPQETGARPQHHPRQIGHKGEWPRGAESLDARYYPKAQIRQGAAATEIAINTHPPGWVRPAGGPGTTLPR